MTSMHTRLAQLLASIDQIDPSYADPTPGDERLREHNYRLRNGLVFVALSVALTAGFAGGFAADPNDPDWTIVYIELPTGQVSWHLPAYTGPWDGHTREEKRVRIRRFYGAYSGL